MVKRDLDEFIEIKFDDFFNNLAVDITRKYNLDKEDAEDSILEWLKA